MGGCTPMTRAFWPTPLRVTVAVALAALLGGCAQAPKPLYHWEGYQGLLYTHLKADGTSQPSEQVRAMTEQAQKAQAGATLLPPGFRAHLAMLYLNMGQKAEASQQLELEKASFPESAQYMDFLLTRMNAAAAPPVAQAPTETAAPPAEAASLKAPTTARNKR